MSLFPIFLKLTGRPCIVIGAGHLAESKIESLLAANAARHRHRSARHRAHRRDGRRGRGHLAPARVRHRRPRRPIPGRRRHQRPAVNRAVFAEAEAAGVLINAVDDPPFCDFYFPSVVRRGDLQIAISTAGAQPRARPAPAQGDQRPAPARHRRLARRTRQSPPRSPPARAPQRSRATSSCTSLPAARSAATTPAPRAHWPAPRAHQSAARD